MSLTLEIAELNFIKLHIKVKHHKMVPFLKPLGSHGKVKVTIKGQT